MKEMLVQNSDQEVVTSGGKNVVIIVYSGKYLLQNAAAAVFFFQAEACLSPNGFIFIFTTSNKKATPTRKCVCARVEMTENASQRNVVFCLYMTKDINDIQKLNYSFNTRYEFKD